jgi:hypothetical protein
MNCPHCNHELTRAEVARLMRAIPSEARSEAARRNGRMPKRPRIKSGKPLSVAVTGNKEE